MMTTTINGQNTQTLSAANSGAPNGSSTTQIWTICPVCGQSYKQGESHACTFSSASTTSPAPTSTGQDYTWWPAHPPNATWPEDGKPNISSGTASSLSLEERRVSALERIADTLEKLAK